jgi:hypothetical protein
MPRIQVQERGREPVGEEEEVVEELWVEEEDKEHGDSPALFHKWTVCKSWDLQYKNNREGYY